MAYLLIEKKLTYQRDVRAIREKCCAIHMLPSLTLFERVGQQDMMLCAGQLHSFVL